MILPPLIRIFITLTYLNNIYYYYFINKYLFINIFFPPTSPNRISISLNFPLPLLLPKLSSSHKSQTQIGGSQQQPSGGKSTTTWRRQIGSNLAAADRWQINGRSNGFFGGFSCGFPMDFSYGFSVGLDLVFIGFGLGLG